jgi:hypothetical protein
MKTLIRIKRFGQRETGSVAELHDNSEVSRILDKFCDWWNRLSMCRKVIASLLIAGWVILSGFDVLEDLRFPGEAAVSKLHDPSSASTVAGGEFLANDIVESAYRLHQAYIVLVDSMTVTFDLAAVLDLHTYFQLHKLYHVFLI